MKHIFYKLLAQDFSTHFLDTITADSATILRAANKQVDQNTPGLRAKPRRVLARAIVRTMIGERWAAQCNEIMPQQLLDDAVKRVAPMLKS